MSLKALVLAPFHSEELERLKKRIDIIYESWTETRRLFSSDELVMRIESQNIQILVVEADFIFEDVFESTDKLKFIGVCRSTPSNVDIESATRHGVLVVNTPARNAVAVAELTIGLMLSLARHIPRVHALVRGGRWKHPVEPYSSWRGVELKGKVAGIIGLGAIGYEVAKRLKAFEMELLVYDPFVGEGKIASVGAKSASLEELLRKSDFVSIHCPLSPSTIHLIDKEKLSLMKPTAYLINTANWDVVEEEALISALQQKQIAGAAFDVYKTHPIPPGSPILLLDNVIFTPHIGGATDGTIKRHSTMIAEDIERFLDGKRPKNLLNPEAWRGDG